MQKRESSLTPTDRSALKLILVMKRDRVVGTKLVDLIQTQTPFRAILATSLLQAHAILHHLACDYLFVTDDDFPEEDLDRLCLLPAQRNPLALLDMTEDLGAHQQWDETHLNSIIRSIERLQSMPAQSLSPVRLLPEQDLRASEE